MNTIGKQARQLCSAVVSLSARLVRARLISERHGRGAQLPVWAASRRVSVATPLFGLIARSGVSERTVGGRDENMIACGVQISGETSLPVMQVAIDLVCELNNQTQVAHTLPASLLVSVQLGSARLD